jgi:hypothetical protein
MCTAGIRTGAGRWELKEVLADAAALQPPRHVGTGNGKSSLRPAGRSWLALMRWHVGQFCTYSSTSAGRPGQQTERRARNSV